MFNFLKSKTKKNNSKAYTNLNNSQKKRYKEIMFDNLFRNFNYYDHFNKILENRDGIDDAKEIEDNIADLLQYAKVFNDRSLQTQIYNQYMLTDNEDEAINALNAFNLGIKEENEKINKFLSLLKNKLRNPKNDRKRREKEERMKKSRLYYKDKYNIYRKAGPTWESIDDFIRGMHDGDYEDFDFEKGRWLKNSEINNNSGSTSATIVSSI